MDKQSLQIEYPATFLLFRCAGVRLASGRNESKEENNGKEQ